MRSAVLLSACAALALACGVASNITSNHWAGVGTGNGDNGGADDGGTSSSSDGSTTADVSLPDGGSQTASFQVMTDKTSYNVELRATTVVQVTIAPQGFTGTVNLAVTCLL